MRSMMSMVTYADAASHPRSLLDLQRGASQREPVDEGERAVDQAGQHGGEQRATEVAADFTGGAWP